MKLLSLFSLCVKQYWRDKRGQDLIEYALMAGFVAVAAGAIMPNVAQSISVIFSKIASVMTNAQNSGALPSG
jgi:pilus assembly protein Flp/PilA